MATLSLSGPGGRIAKLAQQLAAAASEGPDNSSISVTIDNSAWSITAPSGAVLKA